MLCGCLKAPNPKFNFYGPRSTENRRHIPRKRFPLLQTEPLRDRPAKNSRQKFIFVLGAIRVIVRREESMIIGRDRKPIRALRFRLRRVQTGNSLGIDAVKHAHAALGAKPPVGM